MNNNNNNRVNY